jgi:hypothetical protein
VNLVQSVLENLCLQMGPKYIPLVIYILGTFLFQPMLLYIGNRYNDYNRGYGELFSKSFRTHGRK